MLNKSKNGILFISILFFLLIGVLIGVFRTILGNPFWIAGEHYQYLVQTTSNQTLINLVYNYVVNILPQTIYLMPLILGVFSIIFFSKIAKKYLNTDLEYYTSLILFLTLPVFILSHIALSSLSLLLILSLLIVENYPKHNFLFYVYVFILSLFFPILTILVLPAFIYFAFKDKSFVVISSATIALSYLILFFLKLPLEYVWFSLPQTNEIFAFFGGKFGYTILLLIFGMTYLYSEFSKNSSFSNSLMIFYFILSFFNTHLRCIMIFVLIFFASKSISELINKKWSADILKYGAILLICCILFFSLSTAIQDTITQTPTKNHVDALKYLNFIRVNLQEGSLLTDPNYSSFIKYYSGIEPYVQTYKHEELAKTIFYSRQYSKIAELLIQENIKFILIDSQMTSGSIWANDREDLLFVIKYSDNFKEIYSKNGIKIYYFDAD